MENNNKKSSFYINDVLSPSVLSPWPYLPGKGKGESRRELRICSISTSCSLVWCIWQHDPLNQVGYWLSQAWSALWSAGSYKQHLTCDIFQTLQAEWQRASSDPTLINVFLPDFSWDLEEHIRTYLTVSRDFWIRGLLPFCDVIRTSFVLSENLRFNPFSPCPVSSRKV